MIVYGCVVGSWEKFTRYVAPRTEGRQVFATSGHRGIVAPYNAILDVAARMDDLEALILLHDDLELTDRHAEQKFLAALAQPDVYLAGVAGGGGASLYWWGHSPVGHQQTDVRLIDFGQRAGDVTLVEGSCLVLAPEMVQHLRFDYRFHGFHGYDEIGQQVRAVGKRVVVVDVDTHHHNPEGYASPESAVTCQLADRLYREKWGLV